MSRPDVAIVAPYPSGHRVHAGSSGVASYTANLCRALAQRGATVSDVCPDHDSVARRVLHDYGAMFVGAQNILPPPACIFTSEDQVLQFQEAAGREVARIGEATIELQPAALKALR